MLLVWKNQSRQLKIKNYTRIPLILLKIHLVRDEIIRKNGGFEFFVEKCGAQLLDEYLSFKLIKFTDRLSILYDNENDHTGYKVHGTSVKDAMRSLYRLYDSEADDFELVCSKKLK